MATYPASLPTTFQVDGYRETDSDNTIRTSMDVGPDKIRRRTTANSRIVVGTMWLTQTQYTTFRAFFETDTSYGTDTFDFTDVHGVLRTYRFYKPPQYEPNGPINWKVKLEWEELP